MVMVTMMVNVCDDDCYLVMKVILVKEVMSCDVLPVAMFIFDLLSSPHTRKGLRAESARAVTVRQCRIVGWGKTFCRVGRVPSRKRP